MENLSTACSISTGASTEIAAERLASGRESITDIALDTGFNNISYFNRVFKKSFGMTPKAYRQAYESVELDKLE